MLKGFSLEYNMAKLTKEQKQTILDELSHPYSRIQLKCDNDIISLTVEQTKPLKFEICVYVNGSFKSAWLNTDEQYHEQKYLYVRTKCFLKAEHKKLYLKNFGKKFLNEKIKEATHTLYYAFFPSAKTAISHLCKVCEHISIIQDENLI